MPKEYNLILLRHGESEWNALNLFTGWVDVDLSEKGIKEATRGGQLIKEKGIDFYLGHILKKVEEEHEERIKANIEKKAEPKPTGNSEMVTFNPGSVRYEDLKAFLEQQNAQRYKQ